MADINAGLDIATLLLRLYLGLTFMAYGCQKLFGWFDGSGLKGWTGFVGSLRIRPAKVAAPVGALTELGAGVLMVIGWLVPLAAAGIIGSMLVAGVTVHLKNGYFNSKGGITYPLGLMVIATAIAFVGPGRFAAGPESWQVLGLDAGGRGAVAVVLGLVMGGITLLGRAPQTQAQ
jgi:putative oxidoreductase